jgi:hypothetical protein
MESQDRSELLREPEMKREYGFKSPWLAKTRRHGGGPPFIKVGKMIFLKRSDLEAFIAAHRVEPHDAGPRTRGR